MLSLPPDMWVLAMVLQGIFGKFFCLKTLVLFAVAKINVVECKKSLI
jgi:hypothetical protein